MKVRALVTGTHHLIDEQTLRPQVGQYGRVAEIRHRPGDVFELKEYWVTLTDPVTTRPLKDKKTGEVQMHLLSVADQFNPELMVRVPEDTPESFSTAQEALDRVHDELVGGKVSSSRKSKIAEVNS